jgi:hypothetical protein
MADLIGEDSIGVLGVRLLEGLCPEAGLPLESICNSLAGGTHVHGSHSLAEWS